MHHDLVDDYVARIARAIALIEDRGDAEDIPSLAELALGGGTALAMDHLGNYDDVHAAFDALYLSALRRDAALAEAPPLVLYHDQPDEKPEAELCATLYLPIA